MPRLPRSALQRQAVARHKMNPGSGGGVQAVVAPVKTVPAPAKVAVVNEVAQFSHAGAIATTASGDETQFVVGSMGGDGGLIDAGTIFCTGNGSAGDTVLTIYVNGVSIGTLTYGNADTTPQTDTLTATRVIVGDRVGARVTGVATGATGLSGFVPIKG